jgi:hypothetical protein
LAEDDGFRFMFTILAQINLPNAILWIPYANGLFANYAAIVPADAVKTDQAFRGPFLTFDGGSGDYVLDASFDGLGGDANIQYLNLFSNDSSAAFNGTEYQGSGNGVISPNTATSFDASISYTGIINLRWMANLEIRGRINFTRI